MKEVNGGPALQYLERTPSIVHGVHERFVDVQAMVKEWERDSIDFLSLPGLTSRVVVTFGLTSHVLCELTLRYAN